jgi:predicted metal-binding membrane protein
LERLNAAEPRRSLLQLTPQATALALTGAFAWLAVIEVARGMGMMTSVTGLSLPTFVGIWTLMMAAMMLPGVAPVASLYARTVRSNRWRRLLLFAFGYLLIWAVTSLPAFGLAVVGANLGRVQPFAAQIASSAIFLLAGAYQLSPLKRRCLEHCRSPVALLLHYGSYAGRLRDLRVGVHHAAYCVGCCVGLMLILIGVGAMNLTVMLVLAGVILLEKYWTRGVALSRITALAAFGLAVFVLAFPQLTGFSAM